MMRKLALVVLLFAFLSDVIYGIDAKKTGQTFKKKHEQMLYTVVRVRVKAGAGSGTVVWSAKAKDGKCYTYVLTNHHVVKDAITIKDVWDSRIGKQTKKEFRSTVMIEFFAYNNYSKNVGVRAVQASVACYNEKQDIALLCSRDKENPAKHVAAIYPTEKLGEVKLYDELYAVGASLGHAPITTKGILNFMDDEIDDMTFWLSSAQIVFGNSGGAVFRWSKDRDKFEWIGVPSRVAVVGWGSPVTHMGYFIPLPRVVKFLNNHRYRFIVDKKKYTWESEKKVRDDEARKAYKKGA